MEQNWQNFIRAQLITDIGRLLEHGFDYISVAIMVQAIEFMGSLLDDKPLRARNQSKIRFGHAISRLFDKRYASLNANNWLYDKLRNHMAHQFIPSSWIIITRSVDLKSGKHLQRDGEKLIIAADAFYSDFKQACEKLISLLDSGRLKPKKG
ncbi:MAG: hypothetical protein NTW49_00015 [Bacteroidia bacterium]|nr:hypothetical protein [Bacteroidia bacterium]